MDDCGGNPQLLNSAMLIPSDGCFLFLLAVKGFCWVGVDSFCISFWLGHLVECSQLQLHQLLPLSAGSGHQDRDLEGKAAQSLKTPFQAQPSQGHKRGAGQPIHPVTIQCGTLAPQSQQREVKFLTILPGFYKWLTSPAIWR